MSRWASFLSAAAIGQELSALGDELGLDEIEVEAPFGQAARPQHVGQSAHFEKAGNDVGIAGPLLPVPLEDLEDRRVGHPVGRADDRRGELRLADAAVPVDVEKGGDREPRLAGTQAAEAVREPLGEHGQGQAGEVDARPPLDGLAVERAPGLDVMGDVGDVDAEKPAAVGEPPDADGVVEVLGRFAVDGHGRPVAEIPAALEDRGDVEVGGLLGLAADVLGELGPQAVPLDDDAGVDAGVVGPAEDAGQREGRPVGFDDHARLGLELRARLERDVVHGRRVEGLEIGGAAPLDVDAEEPRPSLPDDALDPALGFAELALRIDHDGHLVPRQGPVGVPGGNENVHAAAVRRDKAEPRTRRDEASPDDRGCLGQPKTAAERSDIAPGR